MKYLITESRMNEVIEKYILKNFPHIYRVKFKTKRVILGSTPGNPKKDVTVIEVVIDNINDEILRKDIVSMKHNISKTVSDVFGLKAEEYGSGWGFRFYQLSITEV